MEWAVLPLLDRAVIQSSPYRKRNQGTEEDIRAEVFGCHFVGYGEGEAFSHDGGFRC
jgi:hypothetical protein